MNKTVVVTDSVVVRLLPHLARAATLGHTRRSFLEHLLCTWRILTDWHMPVVVCRAGLMHSAYSTSSYPHALFGLHERDFVRRMIGPEAEDLAFRFCTMDRDHFWDEIVPRRTGRLAYRDRLRGGAAVRIGRRKLGMLLMIESANVAEQSRAEDDGPVAWMSRLMQWWEFLDDRTIPVRLGTKPKLTRRADDEAIAAYRLALQKPPRRAKPLLDRAGELNPWAAEPRIMQALCALEMGDAALDEASKGTALLSAWAVPWDKRLSLNAWRALCDRIQSPPRRPAATSLSFSSIAAILNHEAPKPRWMRV